jgi:hypothetical protein
MKARIAALIVSSVITIASPAAAQEAEADQRLRSAYTDLSTKTGNDYLEARNRLAGLDKRRAMSFLESKRDAATDVCDKLLAQALLAHLRDPGRLQRELDLAMQVATQPVSMRWGLDRKPLPRPNQVAGALVHEFGSDALAFATEMLLKKLTEDWEPWKKEVPVIILSQYGRSTEHLSRTAEVRYGDVKDPRAGRVLLWVVENSDDDRIATRAAQSLRPYASQDLIAQAKAVQQRIQAKPRKELLAEAITILEDEQRSVDENARYWATRPSSAPATQPRP